MMEKAEVEVKVEVEVEVEVEVGSTRSVVLVLDDSYTWLGWHNLAAVLSLLHDSVKSRLTGPCSRPGLHKLICSSNSWSERGPLFRCAKNQIWYVFWDLRNSGPLNAGCSIEKHANFRMIHWPNA